MGVTIHYRSNLDKLEALPKLLNELADIARSMRWECQRIETTKKQPNDLAFRM